MNNEEIKILVVDDEPDILEFISYNLSKEGYDVTTARNGREAIDLAKRDHPALIILDIICLLYTSPSPRDLSTSRMPSSA